MLTSLLIVVIFSHSDFTPAVVWWRGLDHSLRFSRFKKKIQEENLDSFYDQVAPHNEASVPVLTEPCLSHDTIFNLP